MKEANYMNTEETPVTEVTTTPDIVLDDPIETQPIDKTLLDKVDAIKCIAACHNLLDKGYFHHSFFVTIEKSMQFLRALHQTMINEIKDHPDAEKIEDLKKYLESFKEPSNGGN